jgi:hypothetical protein
MAVRLAIAPSEVVIEIEHGRAKGDGIPPLRTSLSLDPHKGYAMTRWWERATSHRGTVSVASEEEIRSRYQEISPGAFFLAHGTWRQKKSGNTGASQARESVASIAIDSVERGNFAVDKTIFDVHHWHCPVLVDFLRAYAPRLPDAETLLAEALAQATREGRCVLLQQTDICCRPRALLSQFIESQRKL